MYEIKIPSNYKAQCVATISNITDPTCIELYRLTQKSYKEWNILRKNDELPNLWAKVFKSDLLDREQIQNGLEECRDILEHRLNKLFKEEIPKFEEYIQNNISK